MLALLRDPGAPPVALALGLQGHYPPTGLKQAQALFDRLDLAEVVKKRGLCPAETVLRTGP